MLGSNKAATCKSAIFYYEWEASVDRGGASSSSSLFLLLFDAFFAYYTDWKWSSLLHVKTLLASAIANCYFAITIIFTCAIILSSIGPPFPLSQPFSLQILSAYTYLLCPYS